MKYLKTLLILFIFSICVTSCTELDEDESLLIIENTQATGNEDPENNGSKVGG